MSNDDVILWQGPMKVEVESMYFKGVWDLYELIFQLWAHSSLCYPNHPTPHRS